MAHPAYLREKARQLRRERKLTIDELAERLALSRSTIYYWVRDLPIPGSGPGGGWPVLANIRAAQVTSRKHRLLREAAYQEGVESCDRLESDPSFRDFVCLYIAEGYKRNRNVVSICNSDPSILKLALTWIRRLSHKPPSFSIQYHADQDLASLCAFWGHALDIEPSAISYQRKSNSGELGRRNWRSRHGVLTIRVSDTYFRARLQAWIDHRKAEWAIDPG